VEMYDELVCEMTLPAQPRPPRSWVWLKALLCAMTWGLTLIFLRLAMAQQSSPSKQSSPAQQTLSGGKIIIPESSVERPGEVGNRGHTNIEIFVPRGGWPKGSEGATPQVSEGCEGKNRHQQKPKRED
jgi:hypothetical protein